MKNLHELTTWIDLNLSIKEPYRDILYANYDQRDKYEVYMQRALNKFRLIISLDKGPKHQRLWEYLHKVYGFSCGINENSEGPEVCFEKDDEYFYGPFHEGADDLDIFEVSLGIIRMYIEYKMRKDRE